MTVTTLKCKKCGDTIFSRARHDMRWCSCHSCAIDGGQGEGYIQITGNKNDWELGHAIVNQTKKELYDDWNSSSNKYGVIKDGKESGK